MEDLENLAKGCLPLYDRLNEVKIKIKNRMCDDIDFKTFPSKYLLVNYEINSTKSRVVKVAEHKRYLKAKSMMVQQILKYANDFKEGRVKIPKAMNMLELIRNDRITYRRDINMLMEQS